MIFLEGEFPPLFYTLATIIDRRKNIYFPNCEVICDERSGHRK
jgi:hypothetical protein